MSNRRRLKQPKPSAAAQRIAAEQLKMLRHGGGMMNEGRTVVCDMCPRDWTDNPAPGGLLYGTMAVCPVCEPGYAGEPEVRVTCPEGMSFADFIRAYRGGDLVIAVEGDTLDTLQPGQRQVISFGDLLTGEIEAQLHVEGPEQ